MRLRMSSDVARELGRYISPIVAKVRSAFDERRRTQGSDEPDALTIDLSDASTVPGAQLILLVNLLRDTLGTSVVITLSGVRPMIMGSLVTFDLPRDLRVIDARGREWPG